MVGSSKILTVSYGTFSCTLEGFDDPFSTMRSIAEYFRDLAADDRYFGAEPPTPDAEMLHRIAEREIQRRVEARVDGDDVILRQIDSGLVEDESDLPASEAIADMADVAAETLVDPEPADPEPVAETPDVAEDTEAAPEPEDADAAELDIEDEVEAEEPASDPVDDSIEEKLSRIRAVVERTRSRDLGAAAYGTTMDTDDADDEADAAELAPGFAGDMDAALISQVMADDAQEAEDADGSEPVDEVTEADLDDLAALDGAAPEEIAEDAFEDEEEDDTDDLSTQEAVTRILSEYAPEDITAQAEARIELPSEDDTPDEDDAPEMVFEAEDEPEEVTAEVEEIEEDASEPDTAEDDEEPEDDVAQRSEEDADDLWNRDFDAEAAEDAQADAEDGAVEEARAGRTTSKSVHLKAPDDESERLESETETAFNENEGTRRRSAIAHLKAAVAATRADKILSRVVGRDLAGDPEEQKDYREDLSKVVKPSRPLSTPIAPEVENEAEAEPETAEHVEPEDERPSPLMLVSELRVEEDGTEDNRPKRVSSAADAEAEASDDGDFGAFAERMGANDLTDLMEAAAAYTAHVEGQPHFSRPQIMRRVATVDPAVEDSREAGLRAFGQLLRQGRIVKLQRGQFTIAEGTRFKPEHRIAGE